MNISKHVDVTFLIDKELGFWVDDAVPNDAVCQELWREFFTNSHSWFPTPCCNKHRLDFVKTRTRGNTWNTTNKGCLKLKRRDKPTPGIFKLEYKGDGIVALCSKTFCGADAATKPRAKGINKGLNDLMRNRYLFVLKPMIRGVRNYTLFQILGARMHTYTQERAALSYFDGKRIVHDDRMTTPPLKI